MISTYEQTQLPSLVWIQALDSKFPALCHCVFGCSGAFIPELEKKIGWIELRDIQECEHVKNQPLIQKLFKANKQEYWQRSTSMYQLKKRVVDTMVWVPQEQLNRMQTMNVWQSGTLGQWLFVQDDHCLHSRYFSVQDVQKYLQISHHSAKQCEFYVLERMHVDEKT